MRNTQLTEKNEIGFNFDQWSELALNDPEAFETMRSEKVAAVIASAPDSQQHRLRCLQWRIDMIRKQAKTPLSACIKISNMMWDTLHQLGDTYQQLHKNPDQPVLVYQKQATMLAFVPRKK
ncbi:MAG: DUF3135 domain-containing protein [Gammaproteobacteria bacterium]|nr:DUF3135 domain-containing protein [Gammaproteobacteria bacterium]